MYQLENQTDVSMKFSGKEIHIHVLIIFRERDLKINVEVFWVVTP